MRKVNQKLNSTTNSTASSRPRNITLNSTQSQQHNSLSSQGGVAPSQINMNQYNLLQNQIPTTASTIGGGHQSHSIHSSSTTAG
jgi:hypothetical protein